MKTIQTEIPEQLYKQAQALVNEGWFRDEKDIFSEAIRRSLTPGPCSLTPVVAGLRGDDENHHRGT